MCLYLGVVEHLVDVVAYCVCRMLELTLVTFMMMCSTAKAKLASGNSNNNELTLAEQ
ncbi:uncharacterized protein LOC115761877 [Drosophila novamexicana]|uniref:Uncharacterized protein n=1 Tax=Drosophila virilis TaxID=7244 RepID=B4LIQ2_DROVI|nr:uncharacterized protein LOC6627215 [Drosophila virilis]XP_030559742.1 uncharacterized protein LOC115761877 [Drosophila novamexicana]EDW61405.1 uncharacterized protein Dvir_GJ20321 [Drosophila virilis]